MPVGMTRKMNHAQSMPDVQTIAIIEKPRCCEGTESEQMASDCFQETSPFGKPVIDRSPLIMNGIQSRSGNPCLMFFRQTSDVQNVIKMPMRHHDAFYRITIPTMSFQGTLQQLFTTHKSPIHHIQSLSITKHEKVHPKRANL
jgi:hypothetical protein